MKRLNIDLADEEHKMFKTFTVATGTTLKEFVLEAMKEKMLKDMKKRPNKETLRAFQSSKTGKDLFKAEDVEDLFNQLEN